MFSEQAASRVPSTGLSQEEKPGQDGLGKEDGGDTEVELPFLRFVPEEIHSHERADAAAAPKCSYRSSDWTGTGTGLQGGCRKAHRKCLILSTLQNEYPQTHRIGRGSADSSFITNCPSSGSKARVRRPAPEPYQRQVTPLSRRPGRALRGRFPSSSLGG